jgi:hypothetical protein
MVLEYIWKETHCSAIRLNLFHIKNKDSGKLAADPSIKGLLKSRKFKWKTVINDDTSGQRFEILEVANQLFVNQMRRSKAEVFRKSLNREDILREPISIYFSSMMAVGQKDQSISLKKVKAEKSEARAL